MSFVWEALELNESQWQALFRSEEIVKDLGSISAIVPAEGDRLLAQGPERKRVDVVVVRSEGLKLTLKRV